VTFSTIEVRMLPENCAAVYARVVARRTDSGLPAWSTQLTDELEINDRRATDLVRGLSPEQLNWTPTEGVWSVGQCLQHLCVTNDVYLPAIAKALDDRPPSPVQDITPGWLGRWFIRTYIEPSPRSKKAQAPRKIAPAPHVDSSVLEVFRRGNDIARALVRRAGAYDVNRIRFKNPLIPLLRFTVGTGLEILWRHQRRHLLQADRIKQAATFPKQDQQAAEKRSLK
jgi:DinB superfamily